MRRPAASLLAMLPLLCNCAGSIQQQQPPIAVEPLAETAVKAAPFSPAVTTAQARRILAGNRARVFKDPDSLRDTKIGQPFQCLTNDGSTCICLQANARNSYGGMAGLKYYVVVLTATGASDVGEFVAPEHCGQMVPFPEMNGRR